MSRLWIIALLLCVAAVEASSGGKTPSPRFSGFQQHNKGGWLQRFTNMMRIRRKNGVQGSSKNSILTPSGILPRTDGANDANGSTTLRENGNPPSQEQSSRQEGDPILTRPGTESFQSTHQHQIMYNGRSNWKLVSGLALQNFVNRYGHVVLRGAQVGLSLYLIKEVASAIEEALEDEDGFSEGALFCKPQDLKKLIRQATTYKNKRVTNPSILPPVRVMDMVSMLVEAGLPLTSDTDSSNSVERVLSRMTKTQANMLQEILHVPNHGENIQQDILTSWSSIVGHEFIKESLLDILSMLKSTSQGEHLSSTMKDPAWSKLLEPPKGVLLHGPPGCGKSMLVNALAKSSTARTLLVSPSTLLKKYVGESNKSVKTLFELARLLSPTIIVIEELDGLFRERSHDEHEVLREVKTEFLQLWDGTVLTNSKTDNGAPPVVLVVGTTNRAFEVDPAVLRRMPVSFFVGLPDHTSRQSLIGKLLDGIPMEQHSIHCNNHASKVIANLVQQTENYSGSDLHQLLKTAVTLGPLRDSRKERFMLSAKRELRPLRRDDFQRALDQIRPTPMTPQYQQALREFASLSSPATAGTMSMPQPESSGPVFYNMGTLHAPLHSKENNAPYLEQHQEEDLSNEEFWSEDDTLDDFDEEEDEDEDADDSDLEGY